jgi:hypothetical protein
MSYECTHEKCLRDLCDTCCGCGHALYVRETEDTLTPGLTRYKVTFISGFQSGTRNFQAHDLPLAHMSIESMLQNTTLDLEGMFGLRIFLRTSHINAFTIEEVK